MERKKNLRHFRDLEVYSRSFDAAMSIFQMRPKVGGKDVILGFLKIR